MTRSPDRPRTAGSRRTPARPAGFPAVPAMPRPVSARPFPAAAALAAVALLLATPARGDEIARRGDAPDVRGEVTDSSRAGVTVAQPGGEPVEVPTAEIEEIRWTGEPPRLPLTRAAEGRGELARALADYEAAAAAFDSAGPVAAGDLAFLQARALGKLALNDPDRRGAAVAALDDFLAARPDHFRTDPAWELLAEVKAAGGDLDGARAALGELADSPSPPFRTAAAVAGARLDLAAGDAGAALAKFDAVLQNAEGRAALDAKLGRADALNRAGNNAEALAVVKEVLAAADPADADLMARAYVRRGNALQATGETKPAILAYLHVDVLYPGAAGAHAESLFHLARLWSAAGFPGRAAEAAAKLRSDYPNSDWAARLAAG